MLLKIAASFQLSMSGDARIFEIKIQSINNKATTATKQQAFIPSIVAVFSSISVRMWGSHHTASSLSSRFNPRSGSWPAELDRGPCPSFLGKWASCSPTPHLLTEQIKQEGQVENLMLWTTEPSNLDYRGEDGKAASQAEKKVVVPGENNV